MFTAPGATPQSTQPKQTVPNNVLWGMNGTPNPVNNGNGGMEKPQDKIKKAVPPGTVQGPGYGAMPKISDDPSNMYPDLIVPAATRALDLIQDNRGFMPVDSPALPGYNKEYTAAADAMRKIASDNAANTINKTSINQLSKLAANGGATAAMRQPVNVLNNIATGQNQIKTGGAYTRMAQNPLSAYQLQSAPIYQSASSGGMNVGTSNFNQALNSQMNKAQTQAYNTLGNTGYVSTQGWEDYSQGNLNEYQQAAVDAAMGAMSASAVNTGQFNGLGDANSQQNQANDVMEKLAAGDYQVNTDNLSELYSLLQSQPSYSEQNLQALATQNPEDMPFIGELEALINDQLVAQSKAAASAAGRGYGSGYESSTTMDAISRNILEGRLAQYNQNVAHQLTANEQMDANRYTGLGMSLDAANSLANVEAGNIGIIQTGAGQLADLGATLNSQQFREAENVAAAQAQNAQLQAIARGEVAGMGNQIAGQQLAGLQGLSAAEIANIERNLNVAGQYQNLGNYLASNQLSAANSVANIQGQNYARQLYGADSLSNLGQQSITNRANALNSLTNVQNANIGNQANAAQLSLQNAQANVQNQMRAQALMPELQAARYADVDRLLGQASTEQARTDAIYEQARADEYAAAQAPFNQLAWYMSAMGLSPNDALSYELGTDKINASQPSTTGQIIGTAGMIGGLANEAGLLKPIANGISSVGGSIIGSLFG